MHTLSRPRQTVERVLQAAVSSTTGVMADYYGERVVGLRGVGKTVLVGTLDGNAEEAGFRTCKRHLTERY